MALPFCETVFAQGTAFTYQGRLNTGSGPANGSYDLTFTLFNAASGGSAVAGPLTTNAVAVSNGLFAVGVDFGAGIYNGTAYWLEIGVRTNGVGSFTTLAPRQGLRPAPYAVFAEGANAAGLSGTIPAANFSGTYGNVVNFNNGADSFDGTFYGVFYGASFIGGNFVGDFIGSGSGLTDVWHTGGNSGTTAGVNFVGTTDNQPLELHVNGQRALRLIPDLTTNSSPDILGGSPVNTVASGMVGVTISGGGANLINGQPAANRALGDFNTIGGGYGNTTGATNSDVPEAAIAGGAFNTASGITSAIGGGAYNLAYGNNATVAGGLQNRANYHSFVGSGFDNSADGLEAAIGSGRVNTVQSNTVFSVIGGGYANAIQGNNYEGGGTIGGGGLNAIQPSPVFDGSNPFGASSYSTIGGGCLNQILTSSPYSTIGGGWRNTVQTNATESTIGGGFGNTVLSNAAWSTIAGGAFQTIGDINGFIGGGWTNTIQVSGGQYAVIGGGQNNLIQGFADHSVIGGGQYNHITGSLTLPVSAVIAGGYGNTISSNSSYAAIGGGYGNLIQTNPPYPQIQFATIAGGAQNANHGTYGFIGGGVANNVFADYATICGGNNNSANWKSAVGGGAKNTANGLGAVVAGGGIWVSNSYLYDVGNTAYGTSATVGGGAANYAAGGYATIGGGYQNTAGVPQNGSGNSPVVGGGYQNTASADFSVVPGGSNNVASGPFCLAAGRRARAETTGEFVWSDSLDFDFDPFAQTGPQGVNNSFNVRSTGGFYIVTGVNGSGGITAGAYLGAGSTSWSTLSDRNAKKNFQPVNPEAVLDKLAAIPIQRWNYKWEPDDATPNLGPMAQDFKAAFYPGRDDKSISTLEFDGVELAAIQGLNEKIEGRSRKAEGRMQKLEAENAELIQRNEILEKRLEKLETMLNSQPERN